MEEFKDHGLCAVHRIIAHRPGQLEDEFHIEWLDGSRTWQTFSDLWEGECTDAFIDYVCLVWSLGNEQEARRLYKLGKAQEEFGAWWAAQL